MANRWLTPWALWDEALSKWLLAGKDDPLIPSWEFPNRSGAVPIVTNTDGKVVNVEHLQSILAAAADVIDAGEALNAALPITFTLAAQPDVPRTISLEFVSHAQITAYTLTITGVDAKGATVTETFTEADGWALETSNAYATITSIIMSARTGTGAGDTMNVGIASKVGLAGFLSAITDVFKVVKSAAAGNAADYSGATNVTPETDYDTVDLSTGAAIVDGDKFTIYYLAS
ncbi:MAG: hypothetical protein PHN44_04370 [Candidatus Marinimicrobia bacterium]|nr:hypothetical protein [Candidatus Neomarinimicrobiota bacterium]